MENYYNTLKISEDSSFEQIKQSYRVMVKQYHPDTQHGDSSQFRKVTQAYKVLSNPESRNDYDKTLLNFKKKNSSFQDYLSNRYPVQGKHMLRMIKEIMLQGHFTRLKIKYRDRALIDVPFSISLAFAFIALIKAPITMLFIHFGIASVFEIEVTNIIMEYFQKAVQMHQSGKILEAKKLYIRITQISQFFMPAHLNLGILYRQLGETQKAVSCFKFVLDVIPFGEIGKIAQQNLTEIRSY
ncbi:MAG: DnaJ domain-containing protein [Desulfobacterales bacterium]|nr:DnaJ domain-containing protein [Desulfobacterales bacterium]MBF0397844.1 DnaJ domain-containing protein [Desulfobacterales bacterium]